MNIIVSLNFVYYLRMVIITKKKLKNICFQALCVTILIGHLIIFLVISTRSMWHAKWSGGGYD